ncbi:MAG: hypothetical protein ACKOAD_04530 [Gammaproteobacteria bacterium]
MPIDNNKIIAKRNSLNFSASASSSDELVNSFSKLDMITKHLDETNSQFSDLAELGAWRDIYIEKPVLKEKALSNMEDLTASCIRFYSKKNPQPAVVKALKELASCIEAAIESNKAHALSSTKLEQKPDLKK